MPEEIIFLHVNPNHHIRLEERKKATSITSKKAWKKRKAVTGYRLSLIPNKPSISTVAKTGQNANEETLHKKTQYRTQVTRAVQRQGLKPIPLPDIIRKPEQALHHLTVHLEYLLQWRLYADMSGIQRNQYPKIIWRPSNSKPLPVDQRPLDGLGSIWDEKFYMAMELAVSTFRPHDPSKGFVHLEQAFQCLKGMIEFSSAYSWYLVLAMLMSIKSGCLPQVDHMMLRHFAQIAVIVWGTQHPFAVVSRSLLEVSNLKEALQPFTQLIMDCTERTLGPEDEVTFQSKIIFFRHTFLLRNDHSAVHDALARYKHLMKQAELHQPWTRHHQQVLKHELAMIFFKFKEWELAESLLLDALTDLHEYVSKGYIPDIWDPATSPIRITNVVNRLTLLGRVLAAQRRFDTAVYILEKAVAAGNKYMPPDYTDLLEAIFYLNEVLDEQNRHLESREVEMDERLASYMLRVDEIDLSV